MKAVAAEAMDDDWAEEAITQDSMVVDLLLRLKHATNHQMSRSRDGKLVADLAPAGWGVRQPRSGTVSAGAGFGSKNVVSVSERRREGKERIGRTCSPSTPLSWSGGSGGNGRCGDGCEALSLPMNRSLNSRSKLCLAGSEVNGASSSKAAIKKKTYAELIEAEDMLLKERINLNQELVMLGATIMEHRAENENLKRIKLDRSPTLMKNYPCIADGICGHRVAPSTQVTPKVGHVIPGKRGLSTTSCKAESDVIRVPNRGSFMLPDLNTMPPEVDSTS
ncbi:hypothetical protein QQ045_003180 [Rhodiola kirilowii]